MTNDKQKDRLVELIIESVNGCARHWAELIANYLLANGVIVPPCKTGDMVYVKYYGEIVNAYVTEFEINSKGIVAKVYIDPDTDREYDAEDLFLTKEEAEAALKGEVRE